MSHTRLSAQPDTSLPARASNCVLSLIVAEQERPSHQEASTSVHVSHASILAVFGLAAAASAQPNWTSQFQFAQTAGGAPIAGNTLALTATGTYTFYVRTGIFNLTGLSAGQANHGLFDWTAAAAATGLQAGESLAVNTATSRLAPFDFGPATTFGGTVAGASVSSIDCARDVAGGATAPWLWDTSTNAPAAQPTSPIDWSGGLFADRGVNTYANVWRFTVNVGTLAAPNIVVTFTGQAGPVVLWSALTTNQPTGPASPGDVHFLGITPQNPILRDYAPVQLTLTRIVPSPSTPAMLLGLAGLLAARRRRT